MTDAEIRNLQAQIDSIGERMEKGFDELKEMFSSFEKRIRDGELREAKDHPVIQARLDATWAKLKEHDDLIKKLDDTVVKLTQTNEILKWILGVITVIGTSLLIKVLIGGG